MRTAWGLALGLVLLVAPAYAGDDPEREAGEKEEAPKATVVLLGDGESEELRVGVTMGGAWTALTPEQKKELLDQLRGALTDEQLKEVLGVLVRGEEPGVAVPAGPRIHFVGPRTVVERTVVAKPAPACEHCPHCRAGAAESSDRPAPERVAVRAAAPAAAGVRVADSATRELVGALNALRDEIRAMREEMRGMHHREPMIARLRDHLPKDDSVPPRIILSREGTPGIGVGVVPRKESEAAPPKEADSKAVDAELHRVQAELEAVKARMARILERLERMEHKDSAEK